MEIADSDKRFFKILEEITGMKLEELTYMKEKIEYEIAKKKGGKPCKIKEIIRKKK